jgi:hypothetical protein
VRCQGSACIGSSPPSSANLPRGPPAPPSSSPASPYVPSSLFLVGSIIFQANVIVTQREGIQLKEWRVTKALTSSCGMR